MRKQLFFIFISLSLSSFGQSNIQCDSITVYNNEFDKFFQNEYNSIKSDTILAIRHCGSTNGCLSTFGLLCWKVNGQYYFKRVERKKGRIELSSKLNKKLKRHLIYFYDKKIFENTEQIEEKNLIYIDDGPLTKLLFKTKNKCWEFNIGYSNSTKDIRVVWIRELLTLI